jgi:Protein of unknown function (DUF993)
MHKEILLPRAGGALGPYVPVGEPVDIAPTAPSKSRVAYAAAHVVCDPLADNNPTLDADLDAATEVCLSIIDDHAQKIDGIKVSLLDASREVEIRRRLPEGVRMYTGDD